MANWAEAGNNLTTDDNVGIGTTNPGAKLEINDGDLLFKAAVEDPGDIVFQSSNGAQKGRIWSNTVAGAGLYLSSGDNTPDLTITATGNVGIGTTDPQTTLHANGVVTVSPGTGSDSKVLLGPGGEGTSVIKSETVPSRKLTTGSRLTFATYPRSLMFQLPRGQPIDAIDRLSIDSDGRVGIGTTQPSARLSIVGQGATEVTGTARSATLLTGAGNLGTDAGNELALATIGFSSGSGNNSSLGIRAQRVVNGSSWNSTAIGLGMDVDNTVRAGANLWLHANGNIGVGTNAPATKLHVVGGVTLTGDMAVSGDVLLTGADCAEQFDVNGTTSLEPGTVVAIDENGALVESLEPYNKKVAGVVSGGGTYRPALLLDGRPSAEGRVAVALAGKVFCKVDATSSPVEFGDLLTTAARPGHAMKAADPGKAFGAVIGKALKSLPNGLGLIPILVALQ